MLTFLFRPKYPSLHWRPKNVTDLLNTKLVKLWRATDDDTRILATLTNCKGRE